MLARMLENNFCPTFPPRLLFNFPTESDSWIPAVYRRFAGKGAVGSTAHRRRRGGPSSYQCGPDWQSRAVINDTLLFPTPVPRSPWFHPCWERARSREKRVDGGPLAASTDYERRYPRWEVNTLYKRMQGIDNVANPSFLSFFLSWEEVFTRFRMIGNS